MVVLLENWVCLEKKRSTYRCLFTFLLIRTFFAPMKMVLQFVTVFYGVA